MKETNLIFSEHQKLLKENELLFKQISNYKLDNELLIRADSLRSLQIKNYEGIVSSYDLKVKQLNDEINEKNKTILAWKIGGITISVGLLIWLIVK